MLRFLALMEKSNEIKQENSVRRGKEALGENSSTAMPW